MQDLNVITKLNAEAHERDIPNQQALGFYVVAEYHGLSYVGYTTHNTEAEANHKACEIGNQVGHRATVHAPTGARQDDTQGNFGGQNLTGLADTTLPASQSGLVNTERLEAAGDTGSTDTGSLDAGAFTE